jgi:chloride channel protein, CIC family
MPLKLMLILGVFKLAATVVSYSSGSSGGIFGPSLYIGGMLGGVVGIFASFALGNPATQPGAFVLVGMGAVFAGIVRAPITSIVIIFEMTNNYSIILPLMAANITSYALARHISPMPIYDALLMQDGIHLPHSSGHPLRQVRASSAMTHKIVTLQASSTVDEARASLARANCTHRAYPLLDEAGRFLGMLEAAEIGRIQCDGELGRKLADLTRRPAAHAHPDHTLDTVLVKLGRLGAKELPVVSRKDPGKLLGIISIDDIAVSLARAAGSDAG